MPSTPSAYVNRLAGMKKPVIAAVDIYNENGLLLLRKGMPIDDRRADLLLLHKLVNPIEHSVALSHALQEDDLFHKLEVLLAEHTDLAELEGSWGLRTKLKSCCREILHMPVLAQKLTVMDEQLPNALRKSLFTGWFAAGIISAMGHNHGLVKAAFCAGVVHEIGMLHLPPELLLKRGSYSAQEWRTMQAHTVIAAKILANVPTLPDGVIEAVRQHHERADGSGYPHGLFSADQSLLGQVIALADSVQAIRFKPNAGRSLNLKHLIPILQVSSDLYAAKPISTVLRELRRLHSSSLGHRIPDYPSVAESLQGKLGVLQNYASALQKMAPELVSNGIKQPGLRSLLVSMRHFIETVLRSGVFYDGLHDWLGQFALNEMSLDPGELKALDETELVVDEMSFMCSRLRQKAELAHRNELLPSDMAKQLLSVLAA